MLTMRAISSCLGLSLLVLVLLPYAKAQSDGNLTLTFSNNTVGGDISFTTRSTPETITCLNLDDIFASSNGGGAIDEVAFEATNAAQYNPDGNYTALFYQQVNTTGDIKDGQAAARVLEVFPDSNCQTSPSDPDWYGFSCQNADGEKYTIPFGVKSISVVGRAESVNTGSCWTLSENAAAAGMVKGGFTAVAAAAMVAVMLTV